MLWIVVPNVTKISCCSVVEQSKSRGFFFIQQLVMLDWAENRHEADRTFEVRPKVGGRENRPALGGVRQQNTSALLREEQRQRILV